jgi:RND family efflux transporter MFP subunit
MSIAVKITSRLTRAAVLSAVIVVTNSCHEKQVTAESPTPVHVADVTSYSPPEGLRYSASVEPFAQANLSFKSAGYVTGIKQVVGADGRRRNVGAGDYVRRGTVLAQIRHQDLKNRFDEAAAAESRAKAEHVEATQNYGRAKALYATQSLTKPDFDSAQAKYDETRAAVNQATAARQQAQLALDDADLRVPFSGYIIARNIELGNLPSPETVAFTIADTRAVKVSFGVPEYVVKGLRLGQEFTIRQQETSKEYRGRVTSIAASANEKNRVFPIEVTVSNKKGLLKPGMIVSISLTDVRKPPVPMIPLSAVVADPSAPGHYAVFVAREEAGKWVAQTRDVTLGETHENSVAVNGVKPGEKVVVIGAAHLKNGDPIQILP